MSKKLKFFCGHFLISLIVALLIISLVFFVWYPAPLAKATGVTNIFLLMLIIDVTLGPLLGLLVYKEGKKTLKMDLSIVISIQIVALSYGLYSIAQARPVWIVFNDNQFELVRNNEIKIDNIEKVQKQFKQTLWHIPEYVAVSSADSPEEKQVEQMNSILNGVSVAQYPERYTRLDNLKHDLKNQSKSLILLKDSNDTRKLNNVLKENPRADAWLPLETYGIAMVVLINKEQGQVVKTVDLRP